MPSVYTNDVNLIQLLLQHPKVLNGIPVKSVNQDAFADSDAIILLLKPTATQRKQKQTEAKVVIIDDKNDLFSLPLRLSSLIEYINSVISTKETGKTLGKFTFFEKRQQLQIANKKITLTEMETLILSALSKNKEAISTAELRKILWGRDDLESHALQTHIYGLRQKLGEHSDLVQTTEDGYVLKS